MVLGVIITYVDLAGGRNTAKIQCLFTLLRLYGYWKEAVNNMTDDHKERESVIRVNIDPIPRDLAPTTHRQTDRQDWW